MSDLTAITEASSGPASYFFADHIDMQLQPIQMRSNGRGDGLATHALFRVIEVVHDVVYRCGSGNLGELVFELLQFQI